MKRIYACIAIVAVLLGVAFYSSWKVQSFAEVISADLDAAAEAIRNADHPAARQALADGAARCDQMRTSMNHLLRTADFTELEAALRAADGHLEINAPEEAFGELRRAPGTGGNAGMALPPAGMTKAPELCLFGHSSGAHGVYSVISVVPCGRPSASAAH